MEQKSLELAVSSTVNPMLALSFLWQALYFQKCKGNHNIYIPSKGKKLVDMQDKANCLRN